MDPAVPTLPIDFVKLRTVSPCVPMIVLYFLELSKTTQRGLLGDRACRRKGDLLAELYLKTL